MATAQEQVDLIKQQGFDATDAEICGWLDERQKEMVGEARARRKRVSVGTTTAGDATYAVPAGIVWIYELTVGGEPYGAAPHGDIASANQAELVWVGNGLFVGDADSSGVDQITLIPTPEEAGAAIEIYAAIKPDKLVLSSPGAGETVTVFVDDRFLRALRYGAMATGWELNAEDSGTADRYEAKFEQGVERYRRWVNRRFRGSGPAQIRVKGLNA